MDATTKEQGALEALSTRWLEAERRQDIAALLEMLTDDAVFLLPNGQAATGKAEIGALMADHSVTIREIRVLDGWAFGFSVLRRGDDGQWRFARGINDLAPEMPMRPA